MHKPSQAFREVFFSFCKAIDTPVSLKCWILYKSGEHLELARTSISAENYTDPETFSKDYAVVSFCSKFTGLKTGLDLEKVAYDSFRKAEKSCEATNRRFKNLRSGRLQSGYERILHDARRKIADVLGPIDYVSLAQRCKWGPGATSDLNRRRAQPDRKYSVTPFSVSKSALTLAKAHIEADPNWFESFTGIKPEGPYSVLKSNFNFEDHNVLQFVPKSAKTHRTIAVEPRLNGFLQQGAGKFIRSKLRDVGINLNDQSINQALASRAYIEGFATVDFSAASDSISYELVYELLPLDWAIFLDSLRSPFGVLLDEKGDVVLESFSYEKFSSMGNAYTFELESLIFWALARSVCDSIGLSRSIVSVFGDDVILPSSAYGLFRDVSTFCGFTINEDKSFTKGSFYESCGKHYFHGVDVTPFYQKELLSTFDSFLRCHNRVKRWTLRVGIRVDQCLLCLRRIARDKWDDTDRYLLSHTDVGDEGWLVPLAENTSYTFDTATGYYTYTVARRSTKSRLGRGSAMLTNWLRTNRDKEKAIDNSGQFGGLVPVNDSEVALVESDLVVYCWNTSLI